MKRIAKKRIFAVAPYQPGKPIEEVKRELGLKSVIKLASNESPYGPSPKVKAAIRQAALTVNRYPEGSCYYLRRELARRLKVRENQLIFGNGSDELIVLALRALVNEGDAVVVAKPSFLIYDIASRIAGAKVKAVPLQNFRYDLNAMARAVTKKTKVIFIGNPDNPCGTYVSRTELVRFLKKIRRNILVFLDEAYYEYVSAADYPDGVKLLKTYKNLIVTRTFSKMYGLAGLRIGYGIANPELIDILDRVREPFNVNSLAQAAALAGLKDRAFNRRISRSIARQRQYLYRQLREMGVAYVETVTNFVLIDCKRPTTKIMRRLLKQGIIVRDMGYWGLKTFIRVTIGTEKENRKFLKALKGCLAQRP